MSSLQPHQTFAHRYQLVELIGTGGFAQVWKVQRDSGFMQAIKIFNRLDQQGAELARLEFERVFDLNHHRLLKATDFGVYEGQPYLVMPLMRHGTAHQQIGKLTEPQLGKILWDIASALAFLHHLPEPIIHQDIKPDNFLIDNHGNYLLADFGISSQLRRTMTQAAGPRETEPMESRAGFSRSGYTPLPYRAPEITDRDIDKRKPINATDIWALGASLFELATGELPFGEFGGMIQRQEPIPPDLPSSFSRELNQILHRCMAKDTWDRPAATELEEVAGQYLKKGIWPIDPPSSTPPQVPPTLDQTTPIEVPTRETVPLERTQAMPPRHTARVTTSKPTPAKKGRSVLVPTLIGLGIVGVMGVIFYLSSSDPSPSQPASPAPQQAEAQPTPTLPPPEKPTYKQEPAPANKLSYPSVPGKYPFTAARYLSTSDLSRYAKSDLRIMRNEIYARNGYIFNRSGTMINYFNNQAWYRNLDKVSSDDSYIYNYQMTDLERHNVEVIRQEEQTR